MAARSGKEVGVPKMILLVAVELAEVAPVGGVAEYVLGLAAALRRRGHDVRIALPAYEHLRSRRSHELEEVIPRLSVPVGSGAPAATAVHRFDLPCPGEESLMLPVLLLGGHEHFASTTSDRGIYAWPNPEPWIAFSRAVVEYVNTGDWHPDVIHCQDAHSSLVPVYVKYLRESCEAGDAPPAARARTVLTIHNLLDRGLGDPGLISYAGLPMDRFDAETFEFYGRVSCFKAGLLSADRVNAVSPTYAEEIASSNAYGFGLEGTLLRLREAGRLAGIVNGIDESRWRMEGLRYDGTDDIEKLVAAKRRERTRLYRQWEWPDHDRALIAFRGRWDTQKNVMALADGAERVIEAANLLVVTWGFPGATPELRRAWQKLGTVAAQAPDRLLVNPPGIDGIENVRTHYAMSDFFLMPSRYEPSGLAQMECQRFGTVPIVRRTGGLADTVSEQQTDSFPSPNGFVFQEDDPRAMVEAVERAVRAFEDPKPRETFIANTLLQRNSWDTRVPEYEALYDG